MSLGPVGVWLGSIGLLPAEEERAAVRELEAAGYGTIWFGETPSSKEALSHAALLLDATERVTVATGIASIWLRTPSSAASGAASLAEAHPGRFVLGLGVSHAPIVTS
ncbi:MAG: LLM class flavin-dependent oxidoreductase, partial [Gaiellaceae bacterium]